MSTVPYIVTSAGVKDGKPYSFLAPVVQGVNKKGEAYAFLNMENIIREDEQFQLASVVYFETKRVAAPKANA